MTATHTGISKPNGHAPPYGAHEHSIEDVARRLGRGKERRRGSSWMTCCPAHADDTPSLSVDPADNGGLVVYCHAGCSQEEVLLAFNELGISISPPSGMRPARSNKPRPKVVVRYPYYDEDGTPAYEKERLDPKSFRWRRPNPDGAGYCYDLKGIRRLPYLLHDIAVRPDQDVHFAEGEKDADTLKRNGLVSTFVEEPNKTDLSCFSGRHCIIHADNDAPGAKKAEKLATALSSFAVSIRIVCYPDTPPGGDVSDWLDAGHDLDDLLARCDEAEAFDVTSQSSSPPADGEAVVWPELTERRQPRTRSQANIRAFLEWRGAVFTFNAFDLRTIVKLDGEVRPVSDDVFRALWLEADAVGLKPSRQFFEDVCLDAARKNTVHPVRAYLDGLVWDERPRLDTWLTKYAGVEDTPLHRAFARKLPIAAVRRVRIPGVKFDTAVIFEGPQGVGKSNLIRTLASDDWFTDSIAIGADPKVVIEQTAGAWLVEMAELSGIRRGEVEHIKVMLSRQSDRARGAYERHAVDRPRQFVLIGTVNEGEYLRDTTGNRRFWPVRVGRIDLAALARDRDQLWAEAAHNEARGEAIELPRDLWAAAAEAQEARLITDPWHDKLAPLLEGETGAVSVEALWRTLRIETHRQDGGTGRRLAEVMRRLGFSRTRLRRGKARIYAYVTENFNEMDGNTRWLLEGVLT